MSESVRWVAKGHSGSRSGKEGTGDLSHQGRSDSPDREMCTVLKDDVQWTDTE